MKFLQKKCDSALFNEDKQKLSRCKNQGVFKQHDLWSCVHCATHVTPLHTKKFNEDALEICKLCKSGTYGLVYNTTIKAKVCVKCVYKKLLTSYSPSNPAKCEKKNCENLSTVYFYTQKEWLCNGCFLQDLNENNDLDREYDCNQSLQSCFKCDHQESDDVYFFDNKDILCLVCYRKVAESTADKKTVPTLKQAVLPKPAVLSKPVVLPKPVSSKDVKDDNVFN